MAPPVRWISILLFACLSLPLNAGQLLWSPGGDGPSLTLSLGNGSVKKTLDLPSGAGALRLTLKKFLLDDARLRLVWKNDGELWMAQSKKIPGDETTDVILLPPGRLLRLEITTWSGTPVASISLRRK